MIDSLSPNSQSSRRSPTSDHKYERKSSATSLNHELIDDEELDEEWETELRQDEKNVEKEMERKRHESSGINIRKRFFYSSIVGFTFLTLGLFVRYVLHRVPLFEPDLNSFGPDTRDDNNADQAKLYDYWRESLQLSTVLYFLSAIHLAYFLASCAAALIKYTLGRRKENTRLLVFYFSKMQTHVVHAATGGISTALLTLFFGIWQPAHFEAYGTGKDFKTRVYFKYAFFLCACTTAWGLVHLAGTVFFRNFSIKFHKSAYYDRVLQALFTEYVLVMLSRPITGKPNKRRKKSEDTIGSVTSVSDLTATADAWAEVKIDKVPIKEKEIITRHVSNIRLAEFVSFLEETPYFLVHSAEHDEAEYSVANLQAFGKAVSKNVLGLLKAPIVKKSKMKNSKSRALSARKLGHRLFHYLKDDNRDHIVKEDFERHLSEPIAEEAFHLFDKDYDGSLDYREFIVTVNEILKERKAISDSLNDAENALSKLESVFFSIASFVWFFVALFLLGVDVQSTFLSLTSLTVGFAFLFGPVVKGIVEGIIFVFISHPFDISDKITLKGDSDLVPKVFSVMRLNMFNTVLKSADNAIVIFPNVKLAGMSIVNLTKSPQMLDVISFNMNTDTPVEKIKDLERLIKRFLAHNSAHYNDSFELSLNKCENFLLCDVRISHRHNFHNMKRYRERRTNAIYEIMQILEHLDIKNEELLVPIRKLE